MTHDLSAGKIHKTHFSQTKEMPWKRLLTISLVDNPVIRCHVCNEKAVYLADGNSYCEYHWLKSSSIDYV